MGVAAALAACVLIATMGSASACSCWRPRPGQQDYELYKSNYRQWQLSREKLVVRGPIIQARRVVPVMPDVRGAYYTAKMQVASVLKGNVPLGSHLTLITGQGRGDCGYGDDLIALEREQRVVTFGLWKGGTKNAPTYTVAICGFSE